MVDDEPLDETQELVLSDLVNRVLDKGVVIVGHVVISVADVDLVALDLRLVLSSIESALHRAPGPHQGHGHPPLLPHASGGR